MRNGRFGSGDSIGSRGLALGVGSWLLLSALLTGYPDEFPLHPTLGNEPASGLVKLRQPWSPYGISVTEDGDVRYEVTVEVHDLPESPGASYRVWLTTPSFDPIVELGAVDRSGVVSGETDGAQLVVVVSREEDGYSGKRWKGPVVLRGFSAGARVQPLGTHSPFRRAPI